MAWADVRVEREEGRIMSTKTLVHSVTKHPTRRCAALIATLGFALNASCAPAEQSEPKRVTTAKLLKAYPAAKMPTSNSSVFAKRLGVEGVDIDGWEGYVAGTIAGQGKDDALFAIHLSGTKQGTPVAGLTFAFVEASPTPSGDLAKRLATSSVLEVRFNNGTGVVSRHVFGRGKGTSDSAHAKSAASDALLQRAFNDAEALLSAPTDSSDSGDASKACLANFLDVVRDGARCVNDAANAANCSLVRRDAVNTAATCAVQSTANVFDGVNTSGGVHTQALGDSADPLTKLFGQFFSLLGAPAQAPASASSSAGAGALIQNLLKSLSGGKAPTVGQIPFSQPGISQLFKGTSFPSGAFSGPTKSSGTSSSASRRPPRTPTTASPPKTTSGSSSGGTSAPSAGAPSSSGAPSISQLIQQIASQVPKNVSASPTTGEVTNNPAPGTEDPGPLDFDPGDFPEDPGIDPSVDSPISDGLGGFDPADLSIPDDLGGFDPGDALGGDALDGLSGVGDAFDGAGDVFSGAGDAFDALGDVAPLGE
jgi:hypothetical protein